VLRFAGPDQTTQSWATTLARADFGDLAACRPHGRDLVVTLVSPLALMEAAGALARRLPLKEDPAAALTELARLLPAEGQPVPRRLAPCLDARRTTSYLGHGIHVYKAKFFPRLVRAVLCALWADRGLRPLRVLDSFVGSGTALLEARLVGLASAGADLDPLSCLISRAKLALARADPGEMAAVIAAVADGRGAAAGEVRPWPEWLTRRIEPEELASIRGDIARIKAAIEPCEGATRDVLRVCLSDAVTRKLKMRFLGIGVGRFALEMHRRSVMELFVKQVAEQAQTVRCIRWFAERGLYPDTPAHVLQADARRLPLADESFDVVITSPPYLPASSGRENYVRSKAAALISLDIMSREQVEALDRAAVGSTTTDNGAARYEALPAHARELLEWLDSDDLKRIKHQPTLEYFRDMALAFGEMRRVLRGGGTAAVVVSKQSQFYEYSTRKPTFTARTAEILGDLAEAAGLEVAEALEVELDKRLAVARPRSLDAYYETILLLRKR